MTKYRLIERGEHYKVMYSSDFDEYKVTRNSGNHPESDYFTSSKSDAIATMYRMDSDYGPD